MKNDTLHNLSFVAAIAIAVAGCISFAFRSGFHLADSVTISSFGKQPVVAVDDDGNVHVVFGEKDQIFYSSSRDGGRTFSTAQKVGQQQKLALGATRGPQVVTTQDYVVIGAADHTGKIMVYRLKKGGNTWSKGVNLLHGDSTAKEGFVALAAGKENRVHAAWLDLRIGHHNNIFSASSPDGGQSWSVNKLVYPSPEGRVCPCCRPSIAADRKGNVYVMFRNELKGARDLYLARSADGGKTFDAAQKLGYGTWMLKQCPMDGGAVAMDAKGNAGTTWRRENNVYYSEPGKKEMLIGEGRASTLVKTSRGNYFAWQQGNQIMVLTPSSLKAEVLGAGIYPRLGVLANGRVLCVWESAGSIVAKELS